MLLLYRIAILLYGWMIVFASSFNEKARKFIDGRKRIFNTTRVPSKSDKYRYWIHAASLGEFEQGRPLMEQLKSRWPESEIVLTFFSPSGYEVRKHFELVDSVLYLPLDTPSNAEKFIALLQPDCAIFIKYEFWYYYLTRLKQLDIPTYSISSIFRKNQYFVRFPATFMRRAIEGIAFFFVQDDVSKTVLSTLNIDQVLVTGDTRFDRVMAIAKNPMEVPLVGAFKGDEFLVVFGSMWQSDMRVCREFMEAHVKEYKFVIAPHNVNNQEVSLLTDLPSAVKYSDAPDDIEDYRVLVIDNMGLLSSIYAYADVAYIGGAFNGTLHNTLEAVVYGIPVIWGKHKNNQKFKEAQDLLLEGVGYEIASGEELHMVFESLKKPDHYANIKNKAKNFVATRTGATANIINKMEELT